MSGADAATQEVLASARFDDEIDLGKIFQVLWAGKWLIAAVAFAGALIAVAVALLLPNIYRAEALLAPNQKGQGGGLSALASQYGGLASLAGIELGSQTDKTGLGIEVLKSRKFISEFIDAHQIMVPLMAAEDWDADADELLIDSDVYDTSQNRWVRKVRPPRQERPSLQEAYKKFSSILSINEDRKTGFVKIAIDFYSPAIAKQWVDWLVQDLNATMMSDDVHQAQQAIIYLNEQLSATSVADLRNVFYRLIEEQTKTIMLAKVTPEYVFRTIDPAIESELKVKPRRILIVFLGLVLGGLIGIFVVYFRDSPSKARESN